jgi:hypothetical protein
MSKKRIFTGMFFLGVLAAAIWLTGCVARQNTRTLGNPPGPVYETAGEILAMPPCKGVVVERAPCYVCLRTADGKGFYIGSPGSNEEVTRFLQELKDGRTYKFPDVFVKYQKQRARAGE